MRSAALAGVLLLGTFGCGDTPIPVDETGPSIVETDPAADAVAVPTTTNVSATFDEALDATTVNSATFRIESGGKQVGGVVAYADREAVFTPTSALAPGTRYTATLTAAIADTSGNALAAAHSWTFETEGGSADGAADGGLDGAPDLAPDLAPDVAGDLPTDSAGPPTIEAISIASCISELEVTTIEATVHDPAGGPLSYLWEPSAGSVIGSGSEVVFDPLSSGPHPCPYEIDLTVTSDASGLQASDTATIIVTLAGDINGDGSVNISDLSVLSSEWGRTDCCDPGTPCSADVNGDCTVDEIDQALMEGQWGGAGCACP